MAVYTTSNIVLSSFSSNVSACLFTAIAEPECSDYSPLYWLQIESSYRRGRGKGLHLGSTRGLQFPNIISPFCDACSKKVHICSTSNNQGWLGIYCLKFRSLFYFLWKSCQSNTWMVMELLANSSTLDDPLGLPADSSLVTLASLILFAFEPDVGSALLRPSGIAMRTQGASTLLWMLQNSHTLSYT